MSSIGGIGQGNSILVYLLPSIAAAFNTYTYIMYPGITFNNGLPYDVLPTTCANVCQSYGNCNAYFVVNGTLRFNCFVFLQTFTSISSYSIGFGYRVKQPSRTYTTLSQISFSGSIYYTFIGNYSDCTAACDAFVSVCAGYTYSITSANRCNLMTQMNIANYVYSPGFNSVIYNATDASNVRKQVSIDSENLAIPIATPTIVTPTPAASPIGISILFIIINNSSRSSLRWMFFGWW